MLDLTQHLLTPTYTRCCLCTVKNQPLAVSQLRRTHQHNKEIEREEETVRKIVSPNTIFDTIRLVYISLRLEVVIKVTYP